MTDANTFTVNGPAGRLQVVAEYAVEPPVSVAVICHPHPLHGGTLHNKVVHQLARAFTGLGAVSVRFNFRGVGQSEGSYDNGSGELDDLLAVVSWARKRWPGCPLWLAGFSFGGAIALHGAQRLHPDWLVTVAPAVNYFPESLAAACPWLLIHGEQDDIVPTALLLRWVENLDVRPQLELLQGAGHFFHGRLNDLKQLIDTAARALLPSDV